MNNHVYIACPLTVGHADLLDVAQKLRNGGFITHYWQRGTQYNEESNIFLHYL